MQNIVTMTTSRNVSNAESPFEFGHTALDPAQWPDGATFLWELATKPDWSAAVVLHRRSGGVDAVVATADNDSTDWVFFSQEITLLAGIHYLVVYMSEPLTNILVGNSTIRVVKD
jgi:hypothetical protein